MPRDAFRYFYRAGFGGAESNRVSSGDPQYPPSGAMIDYWLAPNAGPVTIEIVAPGGKVLRRMSSEAISAQQAASAPVEALAAQRLTRTAGSNRLIWDMQYSGPWDASARRSGRNGPVAAPGTYTVRMSVSGVSQTRRIVL